MNETDPGSSLGVHWPQTSVTARARSLVSANGLRVGLVGAFLSAALGAQAIDCGRATGKIESAICASPSLGALDRQTGVRYDELRKQLDAQGSAALKRQQLDWLAARNRECSSADVGCLQRSDRSRIDALLAIAASVAAFGRDRIDLRPVYLTGTWQAGPVQGARDGMTEAQFDGSGLPTPGRHFQIGPGKLCIADDDCAVIGWRVTRVDALVSGRRLVSDLHLSPGTRVFEGSTGGKWSQITLVENAPHRLAAIVAICNAHLGDCVNGMEAWHPASADAALIVGAPR